MLRSESVNIKIPDDVERLSLLLGSDRMEIERRMWFNGAARISAPSLTTLFVWHEIERRGGSEMATRDGKVSPGSEPKLVDRAIFFACDTCTRATQYGGRVDWPVGRNNSTAKCPEAHN